MKNLVDIEDIEEMRRVQGIEDIELRQQIRALQAGDCVKLTFTAGPTTSETLLVRITSIRGSAFRGKLADGPGCAGLAQLRVGTPVAFTTAHIHSVGNKQPASGR